MTNLILPSSTPAVGRFNRGEGVELRGTADSLANPLGHSPTDLRLLRFVAPHLRSLLAPVYCTSISAYVSCRVALATHNICIYAVPKFTGTRERGCPRVLGQRGRLSNVWKGTKGYPVHQVATEAYEAWQDSDLHTMRGHKTIGTSNALEY